MGKVLILGGGFAAISAAETLASATGVEDEIVLISKDDHFMFYPAIVPMVFGDFMPAEIRIDLRPRLAEHGIRFVKGEVLGIQTEVRTVEVTADGMRWTEEFDYLIVALGRGLEPGSVPGLAENSHNILSIEAALRFKEAIASFDSGSIVVGLCPGSSLPVPVCESALALAEKFKSQIENGSVSVTVAVPTTLDRAFEGAALFRDVEEEFDRMGIRLVSDFAISEVGRNTLRSAFGASLHHDLLMLVPPFGGQFRVRGLPNVTNSSGFANVNSMMQVDGLDGVYAAGDMVATPGPKFGYMAMRQGKVAAVNVLAELWGEAPSVEYVHKIAWAIGEKYTDPILFHYGFWDETLDDFDEDALFGMARKIRDRYGPVKTAEIVGRFTAR